MKVMSTSPGNRVVPMQVKEEEKKLVKVLAI